MTKAHVPVQPGWGKAPNRIRHMTDLDNPAVRRRGPRAPSAGMAAVRIDGPKEGELGFLFVNKTLIQNLSKVNLHNSRSPNSPSASLKKRQANLSK
jgi:hypothetical protein